MPREIDILRRYYSYRKSIPEQARISAIINEILSSYESVNIPTKCSATIRSKIKTLIGKMKYIIKIRKTRSSKRKEREDNFRNEIEKLFEIVDNNNSLSEEQVRFLEDQRTTRTQFLQDLNHNENLLIPSMEMETSNELITIHTSSQPSTSTNFSSNSSHYDTSSSSEPYGSSDSSDPDYDPSDNPEYEVPSKKLRLDGDIIRELSKKNTSRREISDILQLGFKAVSKNPKLIAASKSTIDRKINQSKELQMCI